MDGRPRRSFTGVYKQQAIDLVASSRRSIGSCPGTWPARFGIAALGGTTWGQAGSDGGVVARHNAGDAAIADHAAEIARLQQKNERLRKAPQ